MKAKKCDRCNAFYDVVPGTTGGSCFFVDTNSGQVKTINNSYKDLCPDCISRLKKWYMSEQTRDKETGEEKLIVNITHADRLRTLGALEWGIDKTYREVKKAFLSGKRIYAKCNDVLYNPASYSFGKANPHITWHIKTNGITRNIGLHPDGSFNLELADETRNNITKGDDSKC